MADCDSDNGRQAVYISILAGALCLVCGVVPHYSQGDHGADNYVCRQNWQHYWSSHQRFGKAF